MRKLILILTVVTVMVIVAILAVNIRIWPAWTGVNGKTFWDLAELLIVPAVLAGGVYLFNRAERQAERVIAVERAREAALQAYLDRMTELMLERGLRTSEADDVRDIARAWTLTILRGLDGDRKAILLRFLYESDLIIRGKTVVDLRGGDLSRINQVYATLSGADLGEVNLSEANLVEADLALANLRSANLSEANLSEANLVGADLSEANLVGADFSRADLRGVKLRGADLHRANLSQAYLEEADLCYVNLADVKIDNTTQIDDKWRLVWEIVNQGAVKRDLSGANLTKANLYGANLRGANLRGANLEGAYLYKTDLSWADLRGANLSKTNLIEASLRGAKYSNQTGLPEGFIDHEAIMIYDKYLSIDSKGEKENA